MGLLRSRTVTGTPQSAAAPTHTHKVTATSSHTCGSLYLGAPVCLCPYVRDRSLCAERPWGPPESSGLAETSALPAGQAPEACSRVFGVSIALGCIPPA